MSVAPFPLLLLGCGAVTPLGLSAPSTCAALRACLSSYASSDLFHQSFEGGLAGELERIKMARIPSLFVPPEADEPDRLTYIAAAAVDEALCEAGEVASRCALIVGTREPQRRRTELDTTAQLVGRIEDLLGVRFHARSCVVAQGHVSALAGLQIAQRLLREGDVSACIVGGVDSLCNVDDLERYISAYRVLGATVSKGFIPGEGAAFFVVGSARCHGASMASTCVAGVGIADEDPRHVLLSQGHPTGRGSEAAMAAAMADSGLPESSVRLRISDINGESYRIDDMLLASIRFYKTYRKHLEFWHPAAGVGDMGAASGAMLVIQGHTALRKGFAHGSVVMCESASDGRERAACVVALWDSATLRLG